MALKASRNVDREGYDVTFYAGETWDKGVFLSVDTSGSGINLDDENNVANVAVSASGSNPIGVSWNNVVDIDEDYYRNYYNDDETNKGRKVTIVTRGYVVTDFVNNATNREEAVLDASGYVTNKSDFPSNPVVGRFYGNKDENGFAKLYVNL